jgi:hypothetical protein
MTQNTDKSNEFKEFKLLSSGPTLQHHIMRVHHEKFQLSSLVRKLSL